MPMFQQRFSVRRVAAWLLFAWVLALGAGVAQACGLGLRAGADLHDQTGAAMFTPHHDEAEALHDPDGGQPSPAKASCVKFCGDAKAVTKLDKSVDNGAVAAPPAALWPTPKARSAAAAGGQDLARAQARSDRPPLPAAIEFLRLAL